MPTTFALYTYLFAVTTLYALLLSRVRKLIEPDLTWLEVVVGVALCLLAPYLDQRWHGPLTGATYQWRVWQCFLVGGAPIVVWQVAQSAYAWIRIFTRIFSRRNGNTTDHATSVASERRGQPEADD